MVLEAEHTAKPGSQVSLDKDRLQYKYLFGDCHTLTVALAELTGWPCVVYRDMSDAYEGEGLIIHSAVEIAGTPGVCLDAAGRRIILHDVARRYGVSLSNLSEETVDLDFMAEEFGIIDEAVATARQYVKTFLSEFLPCPQLVEEVQYGTKH